MGLLDRGWGNWSDDEVKNDSINRGLLATGLSLLNSRGTFGQALGAAGQDGMQEQQRAFVLGQNDKLKTTERLIREQELKQLISIAAQRQKLQELAQKSARTPGQMAVSQNGGPTMAAAAAMPTTEPGFDYNGYAQGLAEMGDIPGSLALQAQLAPEKPKTIELNDGTVLSVSGGAVKELYKPQAKPEKVNPNSPFLGVDANGKPIPNTAYQQYELSKIAAGRTPIARGGDAPVAPPKPLPPAALKMQQEALDAIGTASSINADLSALEKQIDSGKLSFGPVANPLNKARNALGISSEESRNMSTFMSSLERLRNESLRLNAGVQTDGDAQRAWNELLQNVTDTKLVKQRLQEIQRINARGVELQKLKVDQVRGNYGAPPIETSQYEKQPNAVGGGGKAKFLGFE